MYHLRYRTFLHCRWTLHDTGTVKCYITHRTVFEKRFLQFCMVRYWYLEVDNRRAGNVFFMLSKKFLKKKHIVIYVTEEPFMHLTVSCRSLICCVRQVFWPGGGWGEQGGINYFTTLFPHKNHRSINSYIRFTRTHKIFMCRISLSNFLLFRYTQEATFRRLMSDKKQYRYSNFPKLFR